MLQHPPCWSILDVVIMRKREGSSTALLPAACTNKAADLSSSAAAEGSKLGSLAGMELGVNTRGPPTEPPSDSGVAEVAVTASGVTSKAPAFAAPTKNLSHHVAIEEGCQPLSLHCLTIFPDKVCACTTNAYMPY